MGRRLGGGDPRGGKVTQVVGLAFGLLNACNDCLMNTVNHGVITKINGRKKCVDWPVEKKMDLWSQSTQV